MVICLQRGADCLHMVQLMPLHPKTSSSCASFKSRLVLPFWYRLTQVVFEKRLLNGYGGSLSCSRLKRASCLKNFAVKNHPSDFLAGINSSNST